MGAYVSSANCAARHGLTPNCSIVLSEDNTTAVSLGGIEMGQFPGDPDIAGAGVLGAFLCVTVASLLLSIASSAWWSAKNIFGVVNRLTREEKAIKNWQISIAGIVEALVITCSDQQVFTGGAYVITLRYAKACSISAYHYNIVANILLVTCATHLMAVTVARHYWQHPYVGVLRITVTTLVFVITGVLLSNQGSGSLGFPTEIPSYTDQYSPMLLPAACFQTGDYTFDQEIKKAVKAGSATAFFTGQIHGWTNYLIMFLFYLIAVGVSLGRVIRRGMGRNGRRKKFVAGLKKMFPFLFVIKRFFYVIFGLYLLAGIALCGWTIANAAVYVLHLRSWVDKSGWMQLSNNGNPENDPSTFGQLVPVLLMSLTNACRCHSACSHRRDSDLNSHSPSRSPSPSTHTHYATISTIDVSSVHERDGSHGEGRNDGLYDYPYNNDKHKAEPVVGIRQVEEEEAEPANIDIDDGPNHGHDHPPTYGQAYDGHGFGPVERSSVDIGISGDQRRWTTGRAPEGGRGMCYAEVAVVTSPFANLTPIYEVDPDADVLLIVSGTPSNQASAPQDGLGIRLNGPNEQDNSRHVTSTAQSGLRIKVSSRHLTLASRVFKNKLQFGIAKGARQSDGRAVDIETLAQIALVVDRFQLYDAVEVYAERWISNLETSHPDTVDNDPIPWIYISHIFRHAAIFKAATKLAAARSTGPIPTYGLPIREKIIQNIHTTRTALLTRTLTHLHTTLDTLASSPTPTPSQTTPSPPTETAATTNAQLLGELIQALHPHRLVWPRPAAPFPGVGFTAVAAAVEGGLGGYRRRERERERERAEKVRLQVEVEPWYMKKGGSTSSVRGGAGDGLWSGGAEGARPGWGVVGGIQLPITPAASPEPVFAAGGRGFEGGVGKGDGDGGEAGRVVLGLEGLARFGDEVEGLVLEGRLGYLLY
ncbi:hypothetical protein F5144DRAFT_589589 [Chaetomium tenue]|uniref:Uncharacterized protein n=1 Tax=Chaetomium tenue TaxID=1854479 RepID=A0ACB7PU79_9PEZI|nr:hypothetical protein F5144DRAFT_589589 [Chaetomium globosum]